MGLPPDVIHQLLFSLSNKDAPMLTVPGLCWLCRMPLALNRKGICSVCARAVRQRVSLCPQCGLPAAHPSLSPAVAACKTAATAASGERRVTLYAALGLLVHQLKFTRRSEIAAALARLLLQEVTHGAPQLWLAASRQRSSAFRSGRADTGGGDLTKTSAMPTVSALKRLRVGQPDHHAGTGDRNTTSSQREVT